MLDVVADILDKFDAALEWVEEEDPLLAPPTPLPADAGATLSPNRGQSGP
jgi:hypothetical protein